jgi:hypothetical protein
VLLGAVCRAGLSAAAEADRQWTLLHQDTPYAVRYYDPQSATPRVAGRREVRTRTVPTDKGNPRIQEIDSLWEFDCDLKLFRNLHTKVVYIDGDVEEAPASFDWSQVQREIWIGRLWEMVCEKEDGHRRHDPR